MARKATLTVYQDVDSQFRLRLVAPNGKIVIPVEGHTNKQNAVRAARSLQRWIADAELVVDPAGKPALKKAGKPALKKAAKPALKMPAAKPMAKRVQAPAGKPMAKRVKG